MPTITQRDVAHKFSNRRIKCVRISPSDHLQGRLELRILWPIYSKIEFIPGSKKGDPDHHFLMSIKKYMTERRILAKHDVTSTYEKDLFQSHHKQKQSLED